MGLSWSCIRAPFHDNCSSRTSVLTISNTVSLPNTDFGESRFPPSGQIPYTVKNVAFSQISHYISVKSQITRVHFQGTVSRKSNFLGSAIKFKSKSKDHKP